MSKRTITSSRGYTCGIGVELDRCWLNGLKGWGHVRIIHGKYVFGGEGSKNFKGE